MLRTTLITLTVAIASAQSVFSYEISDDGETIILMGATISEYDKITNELWPAMRVKAFDVGRGAFNADSALYSAIFVPNDENLLIHHRVGLTAEQLNASVNSLKGKAEMMQVDAYALGGETRYGYLAYVRVGPAWEVFADVPEEWVEAFEEYLPSGMNIVNRCKTEISGGNTTTLYKQDNTETIDMNASLNEHEFEVMNDILAIQGFRVTSMHIDHHPNKNPALDPNPIPHFRPIFKRDSNSKKSTQAFSVGIPYIVASDHESDFSQMTPLWIANVQYYATDVNGHYINNEHGNTYASFMCGFRGRAMIRADVKPGGNFRPDLHSPSLPSEPPKSAVNAIKKR